MQLWELIAQFICSFVSLSGNGPDVHRIGSWRGKNTQNSPEDKLTLSHSLPDSLQLRWWVYPTREAGILCHRAKRAPGPGFAEAEVENLLEDGEVVHLAAALCHPREQRRSTMSRRCSHALSLTLTFLAQKEDGCSFSFAFCHLLGSRVT